MPKLACDLIIADVSRLVLQQDFGLIADLVHGYAQERPHHPALIHDERDARPMASSTPDGSRRRLVAAGRRSVRRCHRDLCCVVRRVRRDLSRRAARRRRGRAARAVIDARSAGDDAGGLRRENPVPRRADRCGASQGQRVACVAAADPDIDARSGSRRQMRSRGRCRSIPARRSTSSIRRARPGRRRESCNRIACAGRTSIARRWRVTTATAVTICSTPLYSNTTLVSFFPTLAARRHRRADVEVRRAKFLALAQRHRATHAMLVPVQYQRIMDLPDFDHFDLSSFRMKFCTSAPFAAALKADILEALAGRPDRVLRDDGRRRHLRPARARVPGQAAHRRPACAGSRHPPDRRAGPRSAARRSRRGRRPLAGLDDERLLQPARQDRGSRVVRQRRQSLHPHRRRRPLRRGRLPHADGSSQGHDHLRRIQHLSERSGERAVASTRRSRKRQWSAWPRGSGAKRRSRSSC